MYPLSFKQYQSGTGQFQEVLPQFQNGRVINISENQTPWFQLFDGNKPNDSFTNQALYGIQNCSLLAKR
jgi:hypothetical protein